MQGAQQTRCCAFFRQPRFRKLRCGLAVVAWCLGVGAIVGIVFLGHWLLDVMGWHSEDFGSYMLGYFVGAFAFGCTILLCSCVLDTLCATSFCQCLLGIRPPPQLVSHPFDLPTSSPTTHSLPRPATRPSPPAVENLTTKTRRRPSRTKIVLSFILTSNLGSTVSQLSLGRVCCNMALTSLASALRVGHRSRRHSDPFHQADRLSGLLIPSRRAFRMLRPSFL